MNLRTMHANKSMAACLALLAGMPLMDISSCLVV